MTLRLTFADRLALVALPLAAIAAIAGLLVPGLYRDTADGIRQARATDLVTLLVAVPTLAIGLWRAGAGSVGGRFVALAALGYLAYSYADLRVLGRDRPADAGPHRYFRSCDVVARPDRLRP